MTLPAPGDTTLSRLVRKLRLLAARTLLTAPGDATVQRFQGWLARELRRRPDEVLARIGHPDVLSPALVLRSGLGDTLDQAAVSLLSGLSGGEEDLLWDRPCLGSSGLFLQRAGPELSGGRPLPARAGCTPLGPLEFCVEDTNPLALIEDHPDKEGNAVDLGDRSVEEWTSRLTEALELVRVALPDWYAELGVSGRRVIPVGYEPERHLSASYREAPGVVYMTLHPSTLTLAEALVHETQHTKLNLLTWFDAVLVNGRTTWTESPVRPDLRPLMGVLLAAHAFVPVAALHAEMARQGHPLAEGPDFERRRAEVLESNARGLAVLDELADPTSVGSRLLNDLRLLHEALS